MQSSTLTGEGSMGGCYKTCFTNFTSKIVNNTLLFTGFPRYKDKTFTVEFT